MEEENKIIIKLNYKEKKEEYCYKEDDLLRILLWLYLQNQKYKKIEDFIFYFENSEKKYEIILQ